MEDLSEFCASGAQYKEEKIAVAENVSLRVITFTPPAENDNPAVVFVAGWVSSIRSWKEVILKMTADSTVYYIETREKISSKVKGKAHFGVEAMSADIVAVISHLDLERHKYILVGSSLGATAILNCCRFLEQVPQCLVLIAPNAVFRVPRVWMVIVRSFYPGFYVFIKPAVKWYLRTFRMDIKSDRAQYEKYCANLDAADPWKLKRAVLDLSKYEVWDLLKDIAYPTLIIGASKDTLHEPDNLSKMAAMMQQATYLDMKTNSATHSKRVVERIREYVARFE